MVEEELSFELRNLFYIIRKRHKLIIIITLACTLAAGIVSFFSLKPVYEAKTSIIVEKHNADEKTQTQYNDVIMYQKLVKTYSEIAKSRAVAKKATSKLDGK